MLFKKKKNYIIKNYFLYNINKKLKYNDMFDFFDKDIANYKIIFLVFSFLISNRNATKNCLQFFNANF